MKMKSERKTAEEKDGAEGRLAGAQTAQLYRHIDLSHGRLYYEVAGVGPPLVFVHAGFFDSGMWDEQWRPFSKAHTVIRYDRLGFGRSDPLPEPVSRREELYALLEHLGVRRAVFVGCSVGGELILDVALERPEMVSALVVVSATPSGFELQGEPPRELIELFAAVEQGHGELAVELALRLFIDGPFRQPGEVDPGVRRHAGAMYRRALAKGSWGVTQVALPDPLVPPAAQRLQHINVPILVVRGALDNPELLRAADFMAAAMPRAEQLTLQASAHLPNMEEPAAFNGALAAFVSRSAEE